MSRLDRSANEEVKSEGKARLISSDSAGSFKNANSQEISFRLRFLYGQDLYGQERSPQCWWVPDGP
jgi:hypothetical protein